MIDDEDQLLAAALGAVGAKGGGAGGRRGATFAAKRLKKNVHEIDLILVMSVDAAAGHAVGILAQAGRVLEAEDTQPTGERVVRAIVGGGLGNMNPVLITVSLTSDGPERTTVSVRGAAKEGLIKQRAGEKTAKHIAELLAHQ
ncbi:hypothetical protein OOK27_50670 [Streptomyces canus]|uniref:hypothetical protein n=1 Tax=Streptomyces canus TaxID=58343 RepID=UPI00224C7C74|nr:hypothetical protein [Streptomyces canus]MCX5262293.1 hypothetical protein [Streptomyces canus]